MKIASWLMTAWLLSSCAVPASRKPDPRDFAVTTCTVGPNEVALAQRRARSYLSRHPAAADVRLLAVQADFVFPSEVADLWIKLSRSETASSAYLQRRRQGFKLFCVLLIDRDSLLPLSNKGYVLANTPPRGAIANFAGYRALYISTGSF